MMHSVSCEKDRYDRQRGRGGTYYHSVNLPSEHSRLAVDLYLPVIMLTARVTHYKSTLLSPPLLMTIVVLSCRTFARILAHPQLHITPVKDAGPPKMCLLRILCKLLGVKP